MQKPASYRPSMSRRWWLQHQHFVLYMLREATVVPLLFFAGCMLAGLWALNSGAEAWSSWQAFMTNPLVILINLLTLAASLFHAATFFPLMPRVMPIRIGAKTLPINTIVGGMWAVVAIIAIALVAYFIWRA